MSEQTRIGSGIDPAVRATPRGGRPSPAWLVGGSLLSILYLLVMVLANIGCPSWFGRTDALLGMGAAAAAGIILAAAALRAGAWLDLVPFACGAAAGVSVVPSLPLLLVIVYALVGTLGPAGTRGRQLRGLAIVLVLTVIVSLIDHALVPVGDAGKC